MTQYDAHAVAIWASQLEESCKLHSALKNVSAKKPVTITVIDSDGNKSNIEITTWTFLRDILLRAADEAVQTHKKLIMEKMGQ